MDSKYQRGKIYKIISNVSDKVYYGSTTQKYLSRRLSGHYHNFNSYKRGNKGWTSSFPILEEDDYEIVLCENFPCNSKDELFQRERWYIENNTCVNKNKPARDEKKERKIYWEKNKCELTQKKKIHYENNKTEINNKKKAERIKCICGKELRKCDLRRHEKTIQHVKFIGGDTSEAKKIRELENTVHRQWVKENKDKVKGYRNAKVECDRCGKEMLRDNISRHKKLYCS